MFYRFVMKNEKSADLGVEKSQRKAINLVFDDKKQIHWKFIVFIIHSWDW